MIAVKSSTARVLLLLTAGLLVCAAVPGCSGCKPDPLAEKKQQEEEEKKKKKRKSEKPKPDFEFGRPRVLPDDAANAVTLVKPGHWSSITQEVKANNYDFPGELAGAVTNRAGDPYEVAHTPFQVSLARPAALPKGQGKYFDMTYFALPRDAGWRERTVWFRRQLRTSRGGREVAMDMQPATYLPSYQYYFLVLSDDPDAYGYVKQLSTVQAPSADYQESNVDGRFIYYQVLLPRLEQRIPLAGNSLTWTSLAYLVWDGVDPSLFSADQQAALLDWLHWGGQLIISGPDSLDALKGSFLEPYLAAQKVAPRELRQADFEALNEHWTLIDTKTKAPRRLEVLDSNPLVGAELVLDAEATDVGHTGGLVAERRVGAGRVVVTAFSLADRELINWGSFDSFFHNGVLRRPRREFRLREFVPDMTWVDYGDPFVRDARLSSQLRYFSRDIAHPTAEAAQQALREAAAQTAPVPQAEPAAGPGSSNTIAGALFQPESPADVDAEGQRFGGYLAWSQAGVAGWNDRSGAADKAREALRDAAGISIPSAAFVLRVLAIYLLILAPVNWGLFWFLGRVEWAWLTAPLLAIIGGVCVVRLAQLDIGFARSVTEVAIVEAHADHPRAHLTRYTALYTSLSTAYDLSFANDAALALPFPTDPGYRRGPYDFPLSVTLRRDRQLTLAGFQVPSNKTGMVHSEEMWEMGGALQLRGSEASGWELRNDSTVSWKDVGVLRRLRSNELEGAWLGDLPAKTTVPLKFVRRETNGLRFAQWDESPVLRSYSRVAEELFRRLSQDDDRVLTASELAAEPEMRAALARFDRTGDRRWSREELESYTRDQLIGELNLGQLLDLAVLRLRLQAGDTRLVGWTEEALGSASIEPSAAQTKRRVLGLVHLSHAPLPAPRPDLNSLRDVAVEPVEGADLPD